MQSLTKIHNYLFYLLILLLPTQLTKHFWPSFAFISGIRIDYLAPTIYLTDLLVFAIITTWFISTITPIKSKKNKTNKRMVFPGGDRPLNILTFLALAVFAGANILSAVNPYVALFKWLKIGEMALLALYIIKTKPSLRITYYLLLITSIVSIVLAWLQFIKGGSIGGILYWIGERTFTLGTPGIARQSFWGREYLRPYATFPHPNVLAGFLTATLPSFLSFKRRLPLKLALTVLWLATIFVTGSQAALLVSVGIIFLLLNRRNKIILTTSVLLVLLIFNFQTQNTSITRRWELTKAAINVFKTSPLIGVGLNNFIVRLSEFYKARDPTFFLQPVHNIYLLILVEGGIVGFLIFMWLLFKVYGISIFNFQFSIFKRIPISNIQYPISLAALLLIGFFDHYLFTLQQGLLLFVIILSLAFLATKKP